MDNLTEKLIASKAIMDRTENIPRGRQNSIGQPMNEDYVESPQVKYNIPTDMQPNMPSREITKPFAQPTLEAIQRSKLPEEIKRLMFEHPIEQPQQQIGITNEFAEKVSRLMKGDGHDNSNPKPSPQSKILETQDPKHLAKLIKESVKEVLVEFGVIPKSEDDTKENFSFRIGKHLFEGKIEKIKKMR